MGTPGDHPISLCAQDREWNMPVIGIGGVFFRARDPEGLNAWYGRHFGVTMVDWTPWNQAAGPTVFTTFPADTEYFPAEKQWMINFRVEDLDDLLARLRAAGIEVITKTEWDSPETGRFARVHDPEGNPVELWEPPAA
jgi:predicted enzyme related to lactoylglutathione lyase